MSKPYTVQKSPKGTWHVRFEGRSLCGFASKTEANCNARQRNAAYEEGQKDIIARQFLLVDCLESLVPIANAAFVWLSDKNDPGQSELIKKSIQRSMAAIELARKKS